MVPGKVKWGALVLAGVLFMTGAHAGGAFHGGFHTGFHAGTPGFHGDFRPAFHRFAFPVRTRGVFFGFHGFHPGPASVHHEGRFARYPYGGFYGDWYRARRAASPHGWRKWYTYSDFSRINYPGVNAPPPAQRRDEDYR